MATIAGGSPSSSPGDGHAYGRLVILAPISLVLAMCLFSDAGAGAPIERLQAQVDTLLRVVQTDGAGTDRPEQSAAVRTIVEDMKRYSSAGVKNSVSTSG